jgi:oligoendopeptidase F
MVRYLMIAVAPSSNLDVRANALLEQLLDLQKVAVEPRGVDAWLNQLSQLEREVQTLWITHVLAVKRNANDANAKAQYKRLVKHWIPQIETQIGVLHDSTRALNLAKSHPQLALHFEDDNQQIQSEHQLSLQAQERVLVTEYDTIASNKNVAFEGRNLTIREVQSIIKSTTDRQKREALWHSIEVSELQVAPKLDALFAQLLELRQELATVSGAGNYVEYVWKSSNRYYTPQEAIEFLNATAEIFADLTAQLDQARARALELDLLKPWDLNVRLNAPSTTMLSHDDYINISKQVIQQIDPEFGQVVDKLRQENRFDLLPRLGKMNGNAAFLHKALNTTEIVCNLTGAFEDLSALLHELGHAIHWRFLTPNNFAWDLHGDKEVEEFFAFVFQFLSCETISRDTKISVSDRNLYQKSTIQNVLARLRSVDERLRMELWIYVQSGEIASTKIDQHYLKLYQRPFVDWSNSTEYLSKQWQHEHLFTQSFYNIEYSISTIAALLFVDMYHKNPGQAIKGLKTGMEVGLSQGFKAIFEVIGIQFPFSREQIASAKNVLSRWLK